MSRHLLKGIGLCMCVLVMTIGCTTSLKGKTIADSRLVIRPTSKLIPGDDYTLEPAFLVDMPNTGPTWKNDIRFNEMHLQFTSIGRRTLTSQRLQVPEFKFDLMNYPTYYISVNVLENSYPEQIYSYAVNWKLGRSWQFSGREGTSGSSGRNGGDGGTGPRVVVEAAYYDVSGTELEGRGSFILVHCPSLNKTTLVKANSGVHRISAGGGAGGAGADGRNRSATEENPEVYGENGADGGDGGDGGSINLFYPEGGESIMTQFVLSAPGGRGGAGGKGGRGDNWVEEGEATFFTALGSIVGVNKGEPGQAGRFGRDGSVQNTQVPLDQMFRNLNMAGFDRNRLSVEPWEQD